MILFKEARNCHLIQIYREIAAGREIILYSSPPLLSYLTTKQHTDVLSVTKN